MKNLITSLLLVSAVASAHAIASTNVDGFDWPAGYSTVEQTIQTTQVLNVTGHNWPEGVTFHNKISISDPQQVMDGANWPEGY